MCLIGCSRLLFKLIYAFFLILVSLLLYDSGFREAIGWPRLAQINQVIVSNLIRLEPTSAAKMAAKKKTCSLRKGTTPRRFWVDGLFRTVHHTDWSTTTQLSAIIYLNEWCPQADDQHIQHKEQLRAAHLDFPPTTSPPFWASLRRKFGGTC